MNARQSSCNSSSSKSTHSGLRAQAQSRSATPQADERQTTSENTPINSNNTRLDYQSTGGIRNRGSLPENGQSRKSPPHGEDQGADDVTGIPGEGVNNHRPWYIRMASRYGSLELENKGSVARDHLALERTFLAWLRTSLTFTSIGIAITQLFRLSHAGKSVHNAQTDSPAQFASPLSSPFFDQSSIRIADTGERLRSLGKPLGTTFIGVAILILLVGFHRFVESQYWIIRGKFPASRGSVALIAFVAAALIIAALVVILAVAPGAVET